MEIKLAEHRGFCFGVRRAQELIEEAASRHGKVATLGPLVHNRQVVERLADLGVRVVGGVEEVDEPALAISAHGAPPEASASAKASGLFLVDGTCPFVRKAQAAARKLAEDGFRVLVFGDPAHREVIGILGWGGDQAQVVSDPADLPAALPGRKLGIVSQTTQNTQNLRRLVDAVLSRWCDEIAELRVVNTICDASIRRQQAAEALAAEVDLMLVVGGRDSANTKRLAEVCARTGTATYQVETLDDLVLEWFEGKRVVGITAGASTPDSVIEAITHRLEGL